MQFRLFSFALIILNCMDYGHCQAGRWRRSKRASYGPNPICKGCLSCSKDNGCIRCQHKLFFFLRREGMRQYGECLHSCPSGYYGLRTPDMNRCSKGCEVGQWSEWGTCSRNNKTCGFKWGLETRTRQIVKKPAKDTIPCPTIAESRRCKMAMRHCPGGRRPTKTKDKKKKKKNLMERAQKQHSIVLATDKTSQ
ncbi:R-spondin-2 isoform X2 [Grus americana]|uniref:R-spondin-2 isoform X2 n=1 Tax=Grus americana TaxID=9117 RepID=UPI0024080F30|nr:R-spondin-2 isoform X2 [Grus americana]